MGATATLWRTHLTTHLDIGLEFLFRLQATLIDTIVPLSKELSIVAVSKTSYRVKESQNAKKCKRGRLSAVLNDVPRNCVDGDNDLSG